MLRPYGQTIIEICLESPFLVLLDTRFIQLNIFMIIGIYGLIYTIEIVINL